MPPSEPAQDLIADLLLMAPGADPGEAQRLVAEAYNGSRELSASYSLVRPPLWHNFLVNTRLRQRGLCFHWAEDLTHRLRQLQLRTFEIRWGIARAGSVREHNCVVITGLGQPFADGTVLDPWRNSGRLYWAPVTTDRYPWVEGEPEPVRGAH